MLAQEPVMEPWLKPEPKAPEEEVGMVEVKVEPSQVLTVTVDPSMVKSEPLDPLDPTSSGMVRQKRCLI